MTLGEKIQKLRKQKGLSQEALAEKVTVTRQTISKWELDQSKPDLDFIVQLSNIFNVSSDYLIKDELTEPDEIPFKKKTYHLSEKTKRLLLIIVSVTELIAVFVCLICDYFTAEKLSWSLIASLSIFAAWLITLPAFCSTKIILKTLLVLSIIPIPYLSILAWILKEKVVCTLGICISLVSIAAVWIIYGIFRKYHKRLWRAFGFSLLVVIPVSIAITHISKYFISQNQSDFTSDIFNSAITLILSLVCFEIDYLLCQRKDE